MLLSKNKVMENLGRVPNKAAEVWYFEEIKNSLGDTIRREKFLKKIHAEIITQTGKMVTLPAGTLLSDVNVKIRTRYENGRNITQDMLIKFKGRTFDIKYIANIHEENEWTEIYCSERK